MLGTVIWRSERRDVQRPSAVVLGGQRYEVEIEDQWVEGPAEAGLPLTRVFEVRTADRRRLRISASESRVDRLELHVDETCP